MPRAEATEEILMHLMAIERPSRGALRPQSPENDGMSEAVRDTGRAANPIARAAGSFSLLSRLRRSSSCCC